ncbi:MAG TPA: thioredoxin domain-containing protein [Sphingomicrobium sp.]|nr:thioredoxin domain-containing protein [Sphingomicrobium sp.]
MRTAICLAAAMLLPATAVAARPVAKPAAVRDWSRTVAVTPEGGFRMGNPDAKVKLVEYGSLACPHCRHFEETGFAPLVQKYVRTGRVSYEFRNLLINGPDISISLLARCSGPANFFAMSKYVYDAQPQWQKKLEDMSDADKAALGNMSTQQQIVRYAEIAGMGPMAARFGVGAEKAKKCLADPAGLQKLLDMTKAAEASGVNHTPTFLIDGKVNDAATWEELEPDLKKALGG